MVEQTVMVFGHLHDVSPLPLPGWRRLILKGLVCCTRFGIQLLAIPMEKVIGGCQRIFNRISTASPFTNTRPPTSHQGHAWGLVEKDANTSTYNTKVELVAKIKEMFEDLSRSTVTTPFARFQSCLGAVVEARAG